MTDVNPFGGHGTLVTGERFVGRNDERRLLWRRLFQARSSAALIGLGGMGKSSLAGKVLAEAAAEGTLTGRVTVSTARCGADVLAAILAMCQPAAAVRTAFTSAGRAADTPAIPIHDLYRMIREALLQLEGIGPKTASWIVRNLLGSDEVAILDVHLIRACQQMRVFPHRLALPKDYDALEERFLSFSHAIRIRPSVLDAVIWSEARSPNARSMAR